MLKTMFSEQNRNLHDDNGIYLHIWLQKAWCKSMKKGKIIVLQSLGKFGAAETFNVSSMGCVKSDFLTENTASRKLCKCLNQD